MIKIDEIIQIINNLQNLSELDEKNIVEEDGYAESIVKGNLKKLNPTQLRKIFDRVKTIERDLNENGWDAVRSDFYRLRPELAYAKARKLVPSQFFKLLDVCMKKIDNGTEEQKKENYARFVMFLESIVAYHKYHG